MTSAATPTGHDVIIVGGGSAGCVLAARLSADPRVNVLLIEAGPDHPDFERAPAAVREAVGGVDVIEQLDELDWGYRAMGSAAGGVIDIPRGRVMGGSGAVNGAIWLRGLPEDFARWAEMVGPEWGWSEMLPVYRAIEADPAGVDDVHGRSGPFPIYRFPRETWVPTQAAFAAACVELGYGTTDDENDPTSMGLGQLPLNQSDGLRWGPARALLTAAVRARPNLAIRDRTRVVGIEFRGRRAVGVRTADGSIIEGTEVILAAGAVGSPHLLLLSGVGPARQLRDLGVEVIADAPGVGEGIRDHPKTWVEWRLHERAPGSPRDPLLQASTRYTATGSELRGDMMLYPNSVVPGPQAGSRHLRIEAVNNLQLSWGRMWLRSTDPDIQPEIDLRLLSEARDRERLVDAIERCMALADTGPMRGLLGGMVRPNPAEAVDRAGLRRYVERTIMTGQHISSSCPMGRDSDANAVVGPDCRVRGVDGLRIIDGSVMPDSIRANTHATILAMAELMARRILAGG